MSKCCNYVKYSVTQFESMIVNVHFSRSAPSEVDESWTSLTDGFPKTYSLESEDFFHHRMKN